MGDFCGDVCSVKFFSFFEHLNFQGRLILPHERVFIHVLNIIIIPSIVFKYLIHVGRLDGSATFCSDF